jgi:hypothetical protein
MIANVIAVDDPGEVFGTAAARKGVRLIFALKNQPDPFSSPRVLTTIRIVPMWLKV